MRNTKSFTSTTFFTIIMLFVFFPIGLYLMWKRRNFNKRTRIIITIFFCCILVGSTFSLESRDNQTADMPTSINVAQNAEEPIETPTRDDPSASESENQPVAVISQSAEVKEPTIEEFSEEPIADNKAVDASPDEMPSVDFVDDETANSVASSELSEQSADDATTKISDDENVVDNPETIPEPPMPQAQPTEEMVWISDQGQKYHRSSDKCGLKYAYEVTVSEAERIGKSACKRCY